MANVLDVLIIGGGLTGILTGYHLDNLGGSKPNWRILEARGKAGGRIRNVPSYEKEFNLDIGAPELFYGDKEQLLNLFPESDVQSRRDFEENFLTISRPVERDDGTLSYRLCVEGNVPDCTSPASYPDGSGYGNSSFVNQSLASFVDTYFLSKIEDRVIVGAPVDQVGLFTGLFSNYNDTTSVTLVNGTILQARFIVMAVPVTQLNLRKKGRSNPDAIGFYPSLPWGIRSNIEETAAKVNKGIRIFVEFSTKFYEDITTVDGTTYWDAARFKDTDKNIVTIQGSSCAFPNEIMCNPISGKPRTKKTLLTKLLDDLDRAYGNNVATNSFVENGNVTHFEGWAKQDYIKMTTVGEFGDIDLTVYEEPVNENIFFAGDYTVPPSDNEIEAGQSAIATADRVKEALRAYLESCGETAAPSNFP